MAKDVNLNLTSPLSIVFRKTVPLAASQTIKQGQWFELDTAGDAVLSHASAIKKVAYIAFNRSDRPDVEGTLPDGTTTVSLGGMTGIMGPIEGTVTTDGYDDGQSYSKDDALTIKSGKLTPAAAGNPVYAIVKVAIGADTLLHIQGNSGHPLYIEPS